MSRTVVWQARWKCAPLPQACHTGAAPIHRARTALAQQRVAVTARPFAGHSFRWFLRLQRFAQEVEQELRLVSRPSRIPGPWSAGEDEPVQFR